VTNLQKFASDLFFRPSNPEPVGLDTWIWASKNKFVELRNFVLTRCEKDIYKALGEQRGIDKLVKQGVPMQDLKPILQKAARNYAWSL
jgi:hypothetical protein